MSMILAMTLALAGPTKEQAKLLLPVKDSPTVQLDPNAAYILVRSPSPASVNLFRIAEPDEVEDYKTRRAEALAKAHAKWVKRHDDWVDKKKLEKESGTPGLAGDEPIEPTEANLAFNNIDQENMLGFGPLFRFAKAKGGSSTYLQRVWPGRYVVYGSVFVNPNGGAAGTCACMGTVSFDAKAGEITDVGEMKVTGPDYLMWPGGLAKLDADEAAKVQSGDLTVLRLTPRNASMVLDPRLSSYKVVSANFHAAGPVPNYYGVQVDRLTAIPGVLGYERDKIVDLTGAANPAAAETTQGQ